MCGDSVLKGFDERLDEDYVNLQTMPDWRDAVTEEFLGTGLKVNGIWIGINAKRDWPPDLLTDLCDVAGEVGRGGSSFGTDPSEEEVCRAVDYAILLGYLALRGRGLILPELQNRIEYAHKRLMGIVGHHVEFNPRSAHVLRAVYRAVDGLMAVARRKLSRARRASARKNRVAESGRLVAR